MRRLFCLAILLLVPAAGAENRVILREGWFRLANGEVFTPLGGFHGNVLPLSRLNLSAEELRRVRPHVWDAQKTDGQGHIDLWDASDATMNEWFKRLAADGVNAIRLFARARIGNDVLDLCGKLNPELKQVFHRAFAAARPYGIRFQLQILPEPLSMSYVGDKNIEEYALPRYSAQELANLALAQRRFIVEKKRVAVKEVFTDPDVLACQKLYLKQALDWVAEEPQIFALEIYNEQGWIGAVLEGKWQNTFSYPWEDEEIRWTAEIVKTIKQRLPDMPVTLSHPGFGVTGFDPLKWAKPAGVDFYSSHLYAGLSGENANIDFAAVTGATGLIIRAGIVNCKGEWGVFSSPVPMELKRYSHRDAIWLSLLGGEPGFLQWTYEFPEEYRWPAKVFGALPKGFSPEPPETTVEIGDLYRRFHTNTRYPLFLADQLIPSSFLFNRQKQADENIQKIFRVYKHSLDIGVPVAFSIGRDGSMSADRFLALDPGKVRRPIRASGRYQLTWLKDAHSPLWIAYLRKRKVEAFGRHYVGVPLPEKKPLEIRLDLPPGLYRVEAIDLSTDKLEAQDVQGRGRFRLSSKTGGDYALVVRPRFPR